MKINIISLCILVLACCLLSCRHLVPEDLSLPVFEPAQTCDWDALKGSRLITPPDSCRTIPWPPSPPIGFQFNAAPEMWGIAGMNPFQPHQILYQRSSHAMTFEREIGFIDLCTGERHFLMDEVPGFMPNAWNQQGWILLIRDDLQIWKIKANGDSLTQLTFEQDERNHYGVWGPEGKYIYCYTVKSGEGVYYRMLDKHGTEVKKYTDIEAYSSSIWSTDKSKIAVHHVRLRDTILIQYPETGMIEKKVIPIDEDFGLRQWGSDNQSIFLVSNRTIYKYHLDTETLEPLFEHGCNNMNYIHLYVSRNEAFLYTNKLIINPIGPESADVDMVNRLIWIDVQAEEEWLVDVSE